MNNTNNTPAVTNRAAKVKRVRKQATCACSAYRFPHREGGGACSMKDGRDENDDGSCGDCQGTGIGWGGPDSSCSSCGGSGSRPAPRYVRDEPDDA